MTNLLYYAAAASTAIAGILHHHLALIIIGSNIFTGAFFIIAGIVQIFWTIPMVAKWGGRSQDSQIQLLLEVHCPLMRLVSQ
jgi:hypothetical protein